MVRYINSFGSEDTDNIKNIPPSSSIHGNLKQHQLTLCKWRVCQILNLNKPTAFSLLAICLLKIQIHKQKKSQSNGTTSIPQKGNFNYMSVAVFLHFIKRWVLLECNYRIVIKILKQLEERNDDT